ncbi:hypothetical protein NC651_033271 [Populus alba x Populus x berolinensis]|nr:hypothetical protein NC651_033271 [Populus alba x Populus x berolinensis]
MFPIGSLHEACKLFECVSNSVAPSEVYAKAVNAIYISFVFLKYLIENAQSNNSIEELYLSLNYPPAQDSTNNGGQSLALKGGAAGSLLLLAFIMYVFLKRCESCTIIFKVRADDASSRPVEEA